MIVLVAVPRPHNRLFGDDLPTNGFATGGIHFVLTMTPFTGQGNHQVISVGFGDNSRLFQGSYSLGATPEFHDFTTLERRSTTAKMLPAKVKAPATRPKPATGKENRLVLLPSMTHRTKRADNPVVTRLIKNQKIVTTKPSTSKSEWGHG